MTGAKGGGGLVVVLGVVEGNGAIGHVALLLLARHEAEDGMGDLLLVELGRAGLVVVAGRLAKLLVGQVVEGLVHGHVTGAEAETVEGTGHAGAERGALVNVGFKRQPVVMLAGGVNLGVPLAGGRLGGGVGF